MDYNSHYECRIDEAQIYNSWNLPCFMTHTKGVAGDSPEFIDHIEALKKMNADLEMYSAVGSYDLFERYF